MGLDEVKYRDYQIDCFKSIYDHFRDGVNKQLIKSATGCHAKETKILMYDGTIKNVENIQQGEYLMGDDSTQRLVLDLYRGKEQMVKIIPIKGESFIVNMSHILSLKKTNTPGRCKMFPDIINISVADYLETNKHFKHLYKLYRTGVEFDNPTKLPDLINPYWLGLWIGDGSKNNPSIVSNDKEVLNYLNEYELPKGYHKNTYHKGNGLWQISYYKNGKSSTANKFREFIKKFSDPISKIIPHKYLTLSFTDRLELLAGLIDSDGSLSSNGYDFINKEKAISRAVVFLARSVGLAAYMSECEKSIKSLGFSGTYWRVSITGRISIIPCKIKRKQATARKQKKNPLVTGFKIEKLEIDNYYGFELDGNHLYCMGDFTVTHNTGKRLMSIFIASKFKRPLFLAHREELIDQAYREFENFFPMQTGIIKGRRTEDDKRIIVSSIQTMVNRYENYPRDMFDCIIVDEAHHYMAESYRKPLEYFQPALLTGWTATPKRLDGLSLGNIFDEMVFDYGIDDGVKDGYLAKIDAFRIQTNVDISKVKKVAGDFDQRELSIEIDTRSRNALIATKIRKYWKGEPTMAFCIDIEHAYNLRDILREHGFSAEAITSDIERCPNRTEIVEDFKNGKIDVLTNVNILTEGFDFSDIGIIAMARPTQSETFYIQMIGRGTRLKTADFKKKYDHEKCIVLDFADITQRHSLINCYELEKNKPIDERIFLSEGDKNAIIEAKKKRTMKLVTFYGADQPIDLLDLPDTFISRSPKMLEGATEKQIEFMKRLGVFQQGMEYTKRDASEAISNEPAKIWQVKRLADLGYNVMEGVTLGQCQQVMRQREYAEEKANKFVHQNPGSPLNIR